MDGYNFNKGVVIYYIDLEAINDQELVENFIYKNMDLNYYYSNSFEPEFYIKLAQAGFISTAMHDVNDIAILLPEIQFEYALLDFEQLHISKKVKQLLNKAQYSFKINHNFSDVVQHINAYHDHSWICQEYEELLYTLHEQQYDNFELISVSLLNENGQLIAGEIGYIIGKTYTSLTGFYKREKAYNNWGKLQLVLLAHYLQAYAFEFWNLGHASLQYKLDLGAAIYSREDFLKHWRVSALTQRG